MTPAEVRAMTLHDANRLFAHWSRYPPVRALVAGFVGFKPEEPEGEKRVTTFQEFKAMVDGGFGKVR